MYVCMYVCMYACMYVCMYVSTYLDDACIQDLPLSKGGVQTHFAQLAPHCGL